MAETFKITYRFTFSDDREQTFDMLLDKDSLTLVRGQGETLPPWTDLSFHQCSICPLNKSIIPFCPIAANLARIAREFSSYSASDEVTVIVTVKERSYVKETTLQDGLSPLLGVVMATSGCPVMEPLKPMARFHLPFASLDETVFRMASMYLIAQYLRGMTGKQPEWNLDGFSRIYGDVKKLNKDFGQRMIAASHNDANVHALVKLNVFAVMVPLEAEHLLKEIAPSFSYYLK